MTNDQRTVAEEVAATLECAQGLHIEPDACASLTDTLRALLLAANRAEAGAWETVDELVQGVEQATSRGDGLGILAERCAPIAAAIRALLDPEDIEHVWAQRN